MRRSPHFCTTKLRQQIATYSFNVPATSIHLDGITWYWFPSDSQIRQWKVSNSKLSTRNNLGSTFLKTTNIKINQTKKLGSFPMFLNTLSLFIKQKSCISLTIDLNVSNFTYVLKYNSIMKFKVYCIQQENFSNNYITFFYNLNPPKRTPSAIKIN